jgi:hypothetical protein
MGSSIADGFTGSNLGSMAIPRTAGIGADLPLLRRPTNAQDCHVAAIARRFMHHASRLGDEIRSMSRDEFSTANRRNWDERVAIHRRDATGFYAVERFLAERNGCMRSTAVGEIAGKRLIHLQCRLVPGGVFYFADAHPAIQVLEERKGRLVAEWAADTPIDEPLVFDEGQTYTGDNSAVR